MRAHELSPRPGILFSQGQALRRLGGRREDAIACYEASIAAGGEPRRAEAEAHIAELRGPAATGVEEVDTATGRELFNRGAAMYDAQDVANAYDEFTKSWELTHRTGLLFSRGQALRRLGGRDPEAIALYEQCLASGDPSRAEEASQHIADLRAPIATGVEEIDTAAGKVLFEKGAVLYDAGDFAHAYDEFTKSWELTHRDGLLFSSAQALRRLGERSPRCTSTSCRRRAPSPADRPCSGHMLADRGDAPECARGREPRPGGAAAHAAVRGDPDTGLRDCGDQAVAVRFTLRRETGRDFALGAPGRTRTANTHAAPWTGTSRSVERSHSARHQRRHRPPRQAPQLSDEPCRLS